MQVELKISSHWQVDANARILQEKRRLQIADFFEEESAEYLLRLMTENKDWYLAYNEGSEYFESSMQQMQALSTEQRQQFMSEIYARAQTQFQYVFHQYYISQAIELNEQPGHPMHALHHFMNSQSCLNLMRELTGEQAVASADCYATLYSPGQFLTRHDDTHSTHNRVAAYTIGMTREWQQNWGGHTAFFDENGNIEQAYIPSFNTLNIFLIPQSHAVQMVTPFAGASRCSYIGWLHR